MKHGFFQYDPESKHQSMQCRSPISPGQKEAQHSKSKFQAKMIVFLYPKITLLEHPPYSPDLGQCHFFLFPKIKSALKGTRFESIYAAKAKVTQLMNKQPAALLPKVEDSHGAV